MTEINLISPAVENHLTRLLEQLHISNYSIDVSPGSTKGDNFLGIIAKVQVNGKNENGKNTTLDLMVKSAPCNVLFRENFPLRAAYQREIYIYSKILPEYIKLQHEKRVKDPFASFAKFYNSTMEDLNEALIMENKKMDGFELWNRFNPVDVNHALLVMKNYGKLHALSFALKDHKRELFEELSSNTHEEIMVEGSYKKEQIEYINDQIEKALSALDPVKHETAYKKLKIFQDDCLEKVYKVLKPELAEEFAIIGHGDCWINNFLFKYGDAQNPTVPTEVCFLDWQLSRLGSPALDLGYFIFTCTDKDLRDEHYEDLINEYYNSFSSFLRELGSDPEKLFPYKVLQEHLKRFSVYGLFMAVMILYFISSDNDELPDVNKIQDIEDAKKQFSYVSKNIDKYRSRIRGVVLDFVKYDYYF